MRRKITMLFAALLACAGVMKAGPTDLPQISTVENPIYYTIYNTRSSEPGGLMYYAGDNVGLKDGCTSLTLEDKYKFFFTGTHEAMYIHNAATGNKLASVDSWTKDGIQWTVTAPTNNGLAFGPKGQTGNVFWNDKNFGTDANTSDFTKWSASDAGSIFVVELAEDFVAPISDLFYVIEAPLFEKVQGESGKKAIYVNDQNQAVWGAEDLTNYNFYWIPTVKDDGTIALKNFGTGKYLSNASGVMSEDAVYGNLNALGSNSFNIKIGGTLHAAGHGNGVNASGTLTNWGGAVGSASAWSFVQKSDPTALQEVVVKYSFTYGNEEKYTQETTTLVGEEYPAITVAFPFGVSAVKPEGVVDGSVTKNIELAVNLPFTYAADYASIENWYYIQMHSSAGYGKYLQAGEGFIEWADATVDANDKDSYTWAFIGNPFDGLMLVNASTGETKAVNADPNANPVVVPALGDYATGTKWAIKASATNKDAEHFCFQYPGSNQYMNAQSGKVAFWSAADQGSTMWVTLRDDAAALQALIDATETQLASWSGTAVGYATASAEAKAAISEALATAEAAIENKTGYDAAEAALKAAVAAAQLYTIQPEASKFYTIANAHTDHRGGQTIYVNEDGGMQFAKTGDVVSEIARVFQFVPAADGKFYLYNVEKGVYLSTAKGHAGGQNHALATSKENAVAVTITNLGKDNQVKIVPTGGAMIHAQNAGSQVVGWDANNVDDASAWKIVETELSLTDLTHTLTVTEAGWATLVLGYNTAIPANASVYAVSAINDASVTLAEVEDVLPAHTPVLIEAAEGEYAFNYTAETAAVENNLLAGSVFNVTVEGLGYILGNKEGVGVGLYKAKCNDEGKFVNNAHKAYLPVAEGDAAPAMFSFGRGEGTTGIDNSQLTIDNVVIYDLTGRRVEKMEKGIYIVNGKKVVIR